MNPAEYNSDHRRAILPMLLGKLRGDHDAMAQAFEYACETMSYAEIVSVLLYELGVVLIHNYDGDAAAAEAAIVGALQHFATKED